MIYKKFFLFIYNPAAVSFERKRPGRSVGKRKELINRINHEIPLAIGRPASAFIARARALPLLSRATVRPELNRFTVYGTAGITIDDAATVFLFPDGLALFLRP